MGGILACLACNAACALCTTCCSCLGCGCSSSGKDVPRDPMVGKMRSLALTIFSIVVGLVFQYSLATYLYDNLWQWRKGCEGYTSEYQDRCAGNAAIYRTSFVDVLFFIIMGLGAATSSLFNNKYWGAKLFLWIVAFAVCIVIPNYVFDDSGYVWPARFGAFAFTILQQVVLIDIAYRWNDAWVAKAEELGDDGEGRKYLVSLVVISLVLFVASLAVLGVLFHYFKGCSGNNVVLSLTLVLCLLVTVLQLTGDQGNLLASAIVTAYAVFLAYSAVSKNPTGSCNPLLGTSSKTSIIIGLVLTVLSLCWVCLSDSSSLVEMFGGTEHHVGEKASPTKQEPFVRQTPVVTDQESGAEPAREAAVARPAADGVDDDDPEDGGAGWKFNVIMALISMYFAMLLTNWGDIQVSGESSDPKIGKVALWMTAAGQWVALLLYGWTLVAPRLFPDREFS